MKHKLFTLLALAGTITCGAFALTACDLFGNGSDNGNNGVQTPSGNNKPSGNEKPSEEAFEYDLDRTTDTYTITGITGNGSNIGLIPATYNGKPVTSIGSYAFYDCSGLTSVKLENGQQQKILKAAIQ